MINYRQTYNTMTTARDELEAKVWWMINIADEISEQDSEIDVPVNYTEGLSLPASYKDKWDIDMYELGTGLSISFSRTDPYEDWTETHQVGFTWEELQYDKEAVIAMWNARGKAIHDRAVDDRLRELKWGAEKMGYKMVKGSDDE